MSALVTVCTRIREQSEQALVGGPLHVEPRWRPFVLADARDDAPHAAHHGPPVARCHRSGHPTLFVTRGSFYLGTVLLPRESLALGRLIE